MIEKARIDDPLQIRDLLRPFADLGLMLPRSLNSIFECLRDFHVYREGGEVTGCCALHITWEGLAEIRSLAVAKRARGRGIGRAMVQSCLAEARQIGVRSLFVLTYIPGFFRKFGFEECAKDKLPHKVWADCVNCHKFPDCDEIAMILDL
jgi:amino-acid N-acetyltransferase